MEQWKKKYNKGEIVKLISRERENELRKRNEKSTIVFLISKKYDILN